MKNGNDFLLSVVVPVFNEECVIEEFVRRTTAVLERVGCRYELLFVNDGSRDASLDLLKRAKSSNPRIGIINFSRNFGHQMAITAGMDHAKGDAIVIIDADLQDPPELIPEMLEKWKNGYDIVYAKRKLRLGETVFKRWTAAFFYRLIKKISKVDIPVDIGDYRLLSRRVLEALKPLRETHRYIRGLVAWIGFNQTFVEYVRNKRYAGKTKFPFSKMLRFSIDGIASFSILPLRFATWLGFISSFLSFLYLPYAFYAKYILKSAVPGWTTVIIAIFFVGGIQLMCMGIMGEYIGILYDESKKRPLYVVSDIF